MLPPVSPCSRSTFREFGVIALVAVATRLLVLAIFGWRGLEFPFVDAQGYVDHARWLSEFGDLAVPASEGGRFFHGLPLLVAFIGRITGEFLWTGVGLNLLLAVGATLLFHLHFRRFHCSLAHAVALPAWLSMTSTLHSEAGMWFFGLVGLWALREPVGTGRRMGLLVIAGFAMVCRPTAFFILFPMFLVAHPLVAAGARPRRMITEGALLGLLPLLVVLWSFLATGELFVQGKYQEIEYESWSARFDGQFPSSVFTWPGQSLWMLCGADGVREVVKLVNVAHFGLWLAGLFGSISLLWRNQDDWVARLCVYGLALNGLFVLVIGGPFGGTMYYRFIATQANVFMVLAVSRLPGVPRWAMVGCCAASIIMASMVASQG